jgi:tetratricopeptide (TPR) repeat protein
MSKTEHIHSSRIPLLLHLLLLPKDEIEAYRIKLNVEDGNDNLGLLGDRPIEMLMHGTEERNEQEEFQLQMAKNYFDRGLDYWTDSEMGNAMREFSKSLEIREDIRGRKDPETAKTYLWVGTIHFLQDEFDRALDDFCRCYRIQYEMANGDVDRNASCQVVMNWINKSLDGKGITDENDKKAYWKKFMTCIEQDQKGDSLKESGKFDRAIESYRTAVKFEYLRRQLNAATPGRPLADCADLHYKIGRCYQSTSQLNRAMMDYREALVIFHAKYGQNHRHTMKTVDHMVDVALEMGYQEELVEAYIESIPKSARFEQTGDWLLDIHRSPAGAIKEYEAALATENGYLGSTQVACATLYYKLGKAYHKWNKPQQAETHLVRAAGIYESVLGAQHPQTKVAMKMIRSVMASPSQLSVSGPPTPKSAKASDEPQLPAPPTPRAVKNSHPAPPTPKAVKTTHPAPPTPKAVKANQPRLPAPPTPKHAPPLQSYSEEV